jgi:excisionase family DNA binding protein
MSQHNPSKKNDVSTDHLAHPPVTLRIRAAADYLSAKEYFVETLLREGEIPFRILGKRRVIEKADLDAWLEKQPKLIKERASGSGPDAAVSHRMRG